MRGPSESDETKAPDVLPNEIVPSERQKVSAAIGGLLPDAPSGCPCIWGRIRFKAPDPCEYSRAQGRGRVRRVEQKPRAESQRQPQRRVPGRKAAHRAFGGCGDRLREVKPSSDRQPASVISTRATSIFEPISSTVSTPTVASPVWTRSAIV